MPIPIARANSEAHEVCIDKARGEQQAIASAHVDV